MGEHKVIYLEPGEGDPSVGRLWCQDDVWDPKDYDGKKAVKYLRADIAEKRIAELERELEQVAADSVDREIAALKEGRRRERQGDLCALKDPTDAG